MDPKHPCQHDSWANWARQTILGAYIAAGLDPPSFDQINSGMWRTSGDLKAIKDNHIGEGDIFKPFVASIIRDACAIVESTHA